MCGSYVFSFVRHRYWRTAGHGTEVMCGTSGHGREGMCGTAGHGTEGMCGTSDTSRFWLTRLRVSGEAEDTMWADRGSTLAAGGREIGTSFLYRLGPFLCGSNLFIGGDKRCFHTNLFRGTRRLAYVF